MGTLRGEVSVGMLLVYIVLENTLTKVLGILMSEVR